MTPREFLAVYECEECGEEVEMFNCLVPGFRSLCEECGTTTRFVAQKVVHASWEWDYED